MLRDPDAVARRLNIFTRDGLRNVHKLHEGIAPLTVPDNAALGGLGVLHKAAARAPPVRRHMNAASHAHRLESALGSVWWFDISAYHQPDFDGNAVAFTGFEDKTTYPFTHLSPRKGTEAFAGALAALEEIVARLRPGTIITTIRGDSAASWADQGRVQDTTPAARKQHCASRPHLSIVTVAPHSKEQIGRAHV
jgi:hypothetical protein